MAITSRRTVIATLGAGLLAACGFELKRPPVLPFDRLALLGFRADSPLGLELRRQLALSANTRVVDSPAQAEAIFEAHRDLREKVVAASTAAGQVRELQLRVRLEFSLRSAAGKELIPRTELLLKRDMNYNERDALAKEQEEALLFRAMQADVVSQVMSRLAAARPS
ncbi:LPS assembly lipoprotein LptE [Roseateles toxinivorans]|uniref:LPS-assembly lipoprotein LptE n=1 Tax=Roseateles toxinivorans TaxID=270368 RepID=A0A4R6QRN4_9BURK|nr:LPS assembly lipoprotein LptE [Roseateles toxinivorans]TDP72885.1 LPS-assembly lipoprotein [Roseateles toxinivorans]